MGNPIKRRKLRKLEIFRRLLEADKSTVPDETPPVKEEPEVTEVVAETAEEPVVKTTKKKKTVQAESDVV